MSKQSISRSLEIDFVPMQASVKTCFLTQTILLHDVRKAYFTVEGSRERYSERLQENTYSRSSSLLGKSLAQTGAKLVLGTTSDVFQVSWKQNITVAMARLWTK
jgi:hypothetical protein